MIPHLPAVVGRLPKKTERNLMLWFLKLIDREEGQATAEYALVVVASAAVALALIIWASNTDALSSLFDAVLARVRSYV
jgi:Flp pilus assembly pilin Flp